MSSKVQSTVFIEGESFFFLERLTYSPGLKFNETMTIKRAELPVVGVNNWLENRLLNCCFIKQA